MMPTRLLWIGANLSFIDGSLERALSQIDVELASSAEAGIGKLSQAEYDVAVLDLKSLEDPAGQLLDEMLRAGTNIPLIVYHKDGSVDEAIDFTRLGAFHTFIGELDPQRLIQQVQRAATANEERTRRKSASELALIPLWRRSVIGESRSMAEICEIIDLIAAKRCTVLITGETGTGKEVIARAIHAASNRASQPLVAVNCTALPASLIETELFGHAKGAFTGAHNSRMGRFEQANRGTIFLDEIGDLPIDAQAKLLRVLQEQEFQRVGSSETVRVDVRVIAATNIDLEQAIRERKFREDLYYRLNVVPIHLPPLRERREDIPVLLDFFLEKIRAAEFAQPKTISPEAVAYLQQRDWPGNIRQLEHAVQMAFALSGDRSTLYASDFRMRTTPASRHSGRNVEGAGNPSLLAGKGLELTEQGVNLDEIVSGLELSLMNQALKMSGGNKARAAELLGIKRTTLLAKLKSRETPQEACA